LATLKIQLNDLKNSLNRLTIERNIALIGCGIGAAGIITLVIVLVLK
jgi:hypothetical protein